MIAPLIKDKKIDPAVNLRRWTPRASRFACSRVNVGRGNFFTDRVAEILGSQSVVTTASDAIGTLTVDILGREFGWKLDDPDRM